MRGQILNATRRLYLLHGSAVSLDTIAREAKTTKVTFYKYFSSKEQLINVMLTEQVSNSFSLATEKLDPSNPRDSLIDLAHQHLELVLARKVIENMTVLVAGSKIKTSISETFFETGPYAHTKALAAYLAVVPQLALRNAEHAAEQFLSMVRGHQQQRLLMGLPLSRDADETGFYIEECVDTFLMGNLKRETTSD